MIGKTLRDRYRVEELVGEGGMAVVYAAQDLRLNRKVAVKVMRAELCADPHFLERFRQEAEAAARLTHPHIAQVFDYGEQDGSHFIVMEYLPPRTLKDLIAERGPLPPRIVVEIGIQLCDALKYAHSNGIVHRDVKPQNILFTPDGHVKVTDFGIARALGASTTLTAGGQVMGSVHYISPEQIQGGGATARSDVYSTGVLLFETLTGKVPFDAETPVAVAVKHLQEPLPSVRSLRPEVPAALDMVISNALRKDPAARYPSAQDLMADLIRVRDGLPVNETAVPPQVAPTTALPRVRVEAPTQVVTPPPPPRAAPVPPEPLVSPATWVLVAITAVGVIGALLFVYLRGPRPQPGTAPAKTLVLVPDVRGMSQQQADQVLTGAGLVMVYRPAESKAGTEPGTVVAQQPAANQQVEPGSAVQVWVTVGEETVEVKDVAGLNWQDAQDELARAGLRTRLVQKFGTGKPKDTVVSQDPRPGVRVAKNEVVTLYIAAEQEAPPPVQVEVPDVTGLTEDEAKDKLDEVGLKMKVAGKVETEEAEPGTVLRQDPAAGKKVDKNSTVEVRLAQAPGAPETKAGPGPTPAARATTVDWSARRPSGEETGDVREITLLIHVGGTGERDIKVVKHDAEGESTEYEAPHLPGEAVTCAVTGHGEVTVKVYDNGKVVEEKTF